MPRLKNSLLAVTFICFLLSCKESPKEQNNQPNTTQALQDNKSSPEIFKKRGYDDDLVNKIYSDLVEDSKDLKDIEKRIDDLSDMKNDSTRSFILFNEKNNDFYKSANAHLEGLKDSALRSKIKLILNSSLNEYNARISRHKSLLTILDSKNASIQDLHLTLKIIRSVGAIENFQKTDIPGQKAIENTIREFDKTIVRLDSMAHK